MPSALIVMPRGCYSTGEAMKALPNQLASAGASGSPKLLDLNFQSIALPTIPARRLRARRVFPHAGRTEYK